MSYIKNHLSPGETIIFEAQITFKSIIGSLITSVLVFALGIIFILYAVYNKMDKLPLILGVGLLIIAIIDALRAILRVKFTELAFTDKKVVGKIGMIRIKAMESPLSKINNVGIDQGLIERIFGYGRIVINTSSDDYIYPGVDRPDEFRRKIMEQVELSEDERIKNQAMQLAQTISNK